MKRIAIALVLAGCGGSPAYQPPLLPPPPGPPIAPVEEESLPAVTEAQGMPPSPPAALNASPSPAAPTAQPPAPVTEAQPPAVYATGRWVYSDEYGWLWIPAGSEVVDVEGVPYAYLYTPSYGWTWYVSPWGWGAYYYGPWVRHPWHPYGWRRGWVASPHVIVHMGPGGPHHHR